VTRSWVGLAVTAAAVVAIVALRGSAGGGGAPAQVSPAATSAPSGPSLAPGAAAGRGAPAPDAEALVVRDVTVHDLDGRVAWRGDVDLAPVLARIARGEQDAHRDDGAVFGNRERRLPDRPHGYYLEYVVRTPGLRSVGPQRLVLGRDGEAFYTSDHYATFTPVRAHGR